MSEPLPFPGANALGEQPIVAAGLERIGYAERVERNGHHGGVVWLTGLSGAGKTTIARALERRLFEHGYVVCVLDGDDLRAGLNQDLSYSSEDRHENIRRITEVARLRVELGFIVIVAAISPFRADRARARERLDGRTFIEVYVNTPLQLCEQRDPKGHYRKARAGLIANFTGISSPYEPPEHPDLDLRTARLSVGECVAKIHDRLIHHPSLQIRNFTPHRSNTQRSLVERNID